MLLGLSVESKGCACARDHVLGFGGLYICVDYCVTSLLPYVLSVDASAICSRSAIVSLAKRGIDATARTFSLIWYLGRGGVRGRGGYGVGRVGVGRVGGR